MFRVDLRWVWRGFGLVTGEFRVLAAVVYGGFLG